MLLVGLVVGRRWAILVGAVGWAAALLIGGVIGAADLPVTTALAATNVAVGVGLRWFLWRSAKGLVGP
jgi:hypothetical protein